MRFGVLPGTAQLYVLSICALAAVVTVLAAAQPATAASLDLFAMLALAAAVAHSFPVSITGKQAYHVSLPFLVAAVILLAPLQLVALVGLAHAAEWLRRRRSLAAALFNTATFTITALAAQAAYRALYRTQGGADLTADLRQPLFLVAGLTAAVIFALLTRCLVSAAIWLGNRIEPPSQRLFEAEGLLTDGILLLMGVPLAHLAVVAPWAAAIGAAPLWLIYRVLELPNLRSQSRQDPLTELFTAAYLTDSVTQEVHRARRFHRPLSLLLFDVDGLRELKAAHGTQAGDAALRATARTISSSIREYDLPARLKDGLFGVLLPETTLAQAQEVAERVRRDIAERRHELPNSIELARLTVSVGGTVLDGGSASTGQLFEVAHGALARAWQDGGNQVEFGALPGRTSARPLLGRTSPPWPPSPPEERGEEIHPNETHGSHTRGEQTQHQEPRWNGVATRLGMLARSRAVAGSLGGGAVLLLIVGLAASIPTHDWRLLAGLTSLAALAGLAFYFKSLTVAVALAIELHRAPARLWLARYWRLWPLYLALGATGLLVAYSYYRFGMLGAVALAAAALLFRQLAGQYVDRTLEGVRTLRTEREQLEHKAFHDPLTGLANRALFAERLERALVRSSDGSVAVLFLDLDNFKTVNDTLGHSAGDALLLAATGRLRECVRREDTIARLGGDEFTVLLEDMRDPSDAVRMAERIGEALGTPFELAQQQAVVSASIGIALDTDRSHKPDDLMREADMAMYRAKSGGKARYEIFDTGLGSRAMERLELETELRNAAPRHQLVLGYQPIVDLVTDRVAAVEALLSWQHPRRGLLGPTEFMALAEQTGIILDLGVWMLGQACRDAATWHAEQPGLIVQVNLSALEVQRAALVELVAQALAASGLPPESLRLEVPESCCSVSPGGDAHAVVLDQLRRLGVRLALDDVGDGVSSLRWLSRAPVDTLKIGVTSARSPVFVRATVALGEALGMNVTAQGVVHADQAADLARLGCRDAQGAFYGAPQSAAAIATGLPGDRMIPRAA